MCVYPVEGRPQMRVTSRSAGNRRFGHKRLFVLALLAALSLPLALAGGCDSARGLSGAALGSSVVVSSATTAVAGNASEAPAGRLLLGVMVHVEGWRNEARDRASFQRHAAMVRQNAAVFEKYGLPLTFEFSPEFISACARWGDNVVKELADRGHGIGVHADLGAERSLTQQRFVSGLASMKRDIESLGVKVRHVSGVCSSLDWVKAVREAGFEFVTGTVEYALKSIPAGRLPAEYRDVLSARTPSECHGNVPHELSDRLHPWRAMSGADWLWHNPSGKVVIIAGDGGTCITHMAEESAGTGRVRNAAFDAADVSAFNQEVDRALACSESDKVNTLYVGWSIGQQVDQAVAESWARSIRGFIDSGAVEWKTLPQMYDAYVEWEGSR